MLLIDETTHNALRLLWQLSIFSVPSLQQSVSPRRVGTGCCCAPSRTLNVAVSYTQVHTALSASVADGGSATALSAESGIGSSCLDRRCSILGKAVQSRQMTEESCPKHICAPFASAIQWERATRDGPFSPCLKHYKGECHYATSAWPCSRNIRKHLSMSALHPHHLLLVLFFLVSAVLATECAQLRQWDIDHIPWDQAGEMGADDGLEAEHLTYQNTFDFTVSSNGNFFSNFVHIKPHRPKIEFMASILRRSAPSMINGRTDLYLSATIVENTYQWKHDFRVEFLLNDSFKQRTGYNTVNYWLRSRDSCVAGGEGWQGTHEVPFHAEDIDHVSVYVRNE